MRRILPIRIKFVSVDDPDSNRRLQMAYNRIFMIAKQNILIKQKIKTKGGVKNEEIRH